MPATKPTQLRSLRCRSAALILVLAAELSVGQAQEFIRVTRVVDGDTIILETGERVRLLGVNAPEVNSPKKSIEAFGKEASEFTRRIVEGKLVRIEADQPGSKTDKHSRILAYVFLQDGTHVNAEIIRQGYGFAESSWPPLKYEYEFRRLEQEAREKRRGLWALVGKRD
jgi:micrococcal nuclease